MPTQFPRTGNENDPRERIAALEERLAKVERLLAKHERAFELAHGRIVALERGKGRKAIKPSEEGD